MHRGTRLGLWALVVTAICYALAVGTFGVINLLEQGAFGGPLILSVPVAGYSFGQFTAEGANGISIGGQPVEVVIAVPGPLNGGIGWNAVILHVIAQLLVIATHVSLALVAARLARGLIAGRPFQRSVGTSIEVATVILLGFGLLSQVIDWIARLVILDQIGTDDFSRAFAFDPLVVTVALALALIALAFRYGTRLQRETDGLV